MCPTRGDRSLEIHKVHASDANTSTNGVTLPKFHVAPHFNHPNLKNAMVPLTMLSASFAVDASTNGVP